jgi:hypothetical protein
LGFHAFKVIRGLDYFRAANHADPRLSQAIRTLESRCHPDGRSLLDRA